MATRRLAAPVYLVAQGGGRGAISDRLRDPAGGGRTARRSGWFTRLSRSAGGDLLDHVLGGLLGLGPEGRAGVVQAGVAGRQHRLGGQGPGLLDVAELGPAVGGLPRGPAALAAVLARGEVPERVGVLLVLLSVGEVAGHGQLLQPVGLELFDGGQPLVLVHGVAGQQELEQVLDAGVVGHVVDAGHLQPALGLGVDVGVEVGQQVAAGDDERPDQGLPLESRGAAPVPVTMACWGFMPPMMAATDGSEAMAASWVSSGAPSTSRATMVASISTWPISSTPVSMMRSLYLPGWRQFQPWNRYWFITVISPYWPPISSWTRRAMIGSGRSGLASNCRRLS